MIPADGRQNSTMPPAHVLLCAEYRVECVPGVRPARATLTRVGPAAQGSLARVLSRNMGVCDPIPPLMPGDASGACAQGQTYTLPQCSTTALVPPGGAGLARAAGADVLLATCDSAGHGMFAIVERVVNQILLARKLGGRKRSELASSGASPTVDAPDCCSSAGAIPYVYVGPVVFATPRCGLVSQPYYDARLGDNVWDYYFSQPSGYRLGEGFAEGRPVRSVQVVSPETLYHQPREDAFTQAYVPNPAAGRMRGLRLAASSVVANDSFVLARHSRRAARVFAAWRASSRHILGMHLRGTDKVVRKKVPPEAYFPFADAWVAAHGDALLFVATDEAAYLNRVVARYGRWRPPFAPRAGAAANMSGVAAAAGGPNGRVVFHQPGFATESVIVDDSVSGWAKGESALLDALLLSKADFLLKTASALAEFAIWRSPRLHARHIDLQVGRRAWGRMPRPPPHDKLPAPRSTRTASSRSGCRSGRRRSCAATTPTATARHSSAAVRLTSSSGSRRRFGQDLPGVGRFSRRARRARGAGRGLRRPGWWRAGSREAHARARGSGR